MSNENRFNIERNILKRGGGLEGKMQGEQVFYVPSDEVKNRQVEELPPLLPFDRRIRVATTGELYVKSYLTSKPINSPFADYSGENYKSIQKVIWNESPDIENAIRRTEHIKTKYEPKTGEVIQGTKDVIGQIFELSDAFHQSGITEQQRIQMIENSASVLASAGFVNAKKPEKQEIVRKIMAAGSRDSLQRINPPRSRLILSNAWIDLTRELIVGRMVKEKYNGIHERLLRERQMERFLLKQTAMRLNEIKMTRDRSVERDQAFKDLSKFIYQYNSPEHIKAKPYSHAAAKVRFFRFGDGDVENENNNLQTLKKYIGDDYEAFRGMKKFDKLNTEEISKRLDDMNHEIQKAIDFGDENLPVK